MLVKRTILKIMHNKIFYLMIASLFTVGAYAKPLITVHKSIDANKFAQVKITNETIQELACYVAIDGRKIRFRLLPHRTTRWFKANDTRFVLSAISTWCDFIELYPNFKKFKAY